MGYWEEKKKINESFIKTNDKLISDKMIEQILLFIKFMQITIDSDTQYEYFIEIGWADHWYFNLFVCQTQRLHDIVVIP